MLFPVTSVPTFHDPTSSGQGFWRLCSGFLTLTVATLVGWSLAVNPGGGWGVWSHLAQLGNTPGTRQPVWIPARSAGFFVASLLLSPSLGTLPLY